LCVTVLACAITAPPKTQVKTALGLQKKEGANMDEKKLEKTFNHGVYVWIWSIQFGALSGVTFSLLNYALDNRWGVLSLSLVLLLSIAILLIVLSWQFVLSYLTRLIFPIFFKSEVGEEELEERKKRAAKDLKFSIVLMVGSILFRLLMEVAELVLNVLTRY